MSEAYKQGHTFGMDFGTSHFKFGPITAGERPDIIENRGYFTDKTSVMQQIGGPVRSVIVGKDLPFYLESREDLSTRLVYPMRNGVIEKDNDRSWTVVEEIAKFALESYRPPESEFLGYYLVASLSAVSPRYMYEKLFEVMHKIDSEFGSITAATIIPQPFSVAIAHKIPTCVVIESGHGNSQICPISKYPVRNAVVALNRGGGDGNALTAEILKDCGYGDLVHEESFVRTVKENIGLIPVDLDASIQMARNDPDRFKAVYRVPGTRINVDLGQNSWMRFLIGEYVFDPDHELFQSYFSRSLRKPGDVRFGDTLFRGMLDFGDAIIEAVERCPVELQSHLYRQILLSGGNFAWKVPEGLEDAAVSPPAKVRSLLEEKGISDPTVTIAQNPQYSVWRGCIIYGYAVPVDFSWTWERFEGWLGFR
jgi:crenactin